MVAALKYVWESDRTDVFNIFKTDFKEGAVLKNQQAFTK